MVERRAELVLGPLLRYAGTESATFWVETSTACEVEILGHRTETFTVENHHYALLLVEGTYYSPDQCKRVNSIGHQQPTPITSYRL